MKNTGTTCLEPASLTQEDRASLDQLNNALNDTLSDERPKLKGREGVEIELPDAIFHVLVKAVREMQAGRCVALLPVNEPYTTQAAANFLGVSRPFLVRLLETGKIRYHRVGAHRRVQLQDLLKYLDERDSQRREALDSFMDKVDEAGLYDGSYKGDATG